MYKPQVLPCITFSVLPVSIFLSETGLDNRNGVVNLSEDRSPREMGAFDDFFSTCS